MCRWLAYSGEPIQPSALVFDSQHSVVAMSRDSPLGAETVNGDGFGLGWYSGQETGAPHPFVFRSTEPAWQDENLREISHAVRSPLFFTHVRAANSAVQRTNCHPFRHGEWLFMHNGYLADFDVIKREIILAIDPELYPHIAGSTDSEALFYLALTLGLAEDPVRGMAGAIRAVEEMGHAAGITYPVQGTFAVSDGRRLWAFRYSSEGRSRTLFHSADMPTLRRMFPGFARLSVFGDRARTIVSEPLTDLPGAFIEVPESTVVVVDGDGYHHEPFLAA